MKSNKWMSIGAAIVVAGVLALGLAHASLGVVSAGNCEGRCPTPTAPAAEPTRGKLRTHTPTATSTAAPKTNTPVPPTAAPTNTPKPASGNEGVAVKPPNTGSGDAGSGTASLWLLVLGGAAIALGGGAFAVGVRRR